MHDDKSRNWKRSWCMIATFCLAPILALRAWKVNPIVNRKLKISLLTQKTYILTYYMAILPYLIKQGMVRRPSWKWRPFWLKTKCFASRVLKMSFLIWKTYILTYYLNILIESCNLWKKGVCPGSHLENAAILVKCQIFLPQEYWKWVSWYGKHTFWHITWPY